MSNIRELSQLAASIVVDDSTRNIGIGTSTPVAKLSVVGDLNVSGVITASSFYGSGLNLTDLPQSGIGIQSGGSVIGSGITTLNFIGAGNTFSVSENTVNISISGGGGASVSISTIAPSLPNAGDLWYSPTYARTFIYYEDNNGSQWVDASPFNVGINSSSSGSNTSVTVSDTSPSAPDGGDLWFNTNHGRLYIFYNDNDSYQWIDASPFNIGIVTTAQLAQGLSGIPDIDVNHIEGTSLNLSGIATALNFDTFSDQTLKENIIDIDDPISKVIQLRGVKFDWKQDGSSSYGVIAQELEKVLPELVHGNNPKTVNYDGIIGVLIEAIKEQQIQIDIQNAKIENLIKLINK